MSKKGYNIRNGLTVTGNNRPKKKKSGKYDGRKKKDVREYAPMYTRFGYYLDNAQAWITNVTIGEVVDLTNNEIKRLHSEVIQVHLVIRKSFWIELSSFDYIPYLVHEETFDASQLTLKELMLLSCCNNYFSTRFLECARSNFYSRLTVNVETIPIHIVDNVFGFLNDNRSLLPYMRRDELHETARRF